MIPATFKEFYENIQKHSELHRSLKRPRKSVAEEVEIPVDVQASQVALKDIKKEEEVVLEDVTNDE